MTRPILATVRRSALRNNLAVARRHAPDARLMAVVKANGYGHGALRVAAALSDADGFAVLEAGSALELRAAGHTQPILMLEGVFETGELHLLSAHRVAVVVHTLEQLRMLLEGAFPAAVDVFLKLNTGMNRLGFPVQDAAALHDRLAKSDQVRSVTLMTHFATADEPAGIDWQLHAFDALCAGRGTPVSVANSATLLRHPERARDWARIGIMLYGASPFPEQSAAAFGLQPVMTLESQLIAVRELAPGDRVGYGCTFIAERAMRMGVVACGYADGYPRHAPTGTPVLVGGRRTRTLGRVSMDMLCVDLEGLPDAAVGTRVVLWGDGLPVEEVAAAAGTISYELLCALAPRVPVHEVE